MPKSNRKNDNAFNLRLVKQALEYENMMRFIMFSCSIIIMVIVIGTIFWILPVTLFVGFSVSLAMCYWSIQRTLGKNPKYWWFLWKTPILSSKMCSLHEIKDMQQWLHTLETNKDYYTIFEFRYNSAHHIDDTDYYRESSLIIKFRNYQHAVYFKLIWG